MRFMEKLRRFNNRVAKILPGLKTKLLALIVALPSAILVVLEMFGAVNWDWKLFVGDFAPYAGLIIAILMYWFRLLADKHRNIECA